MSPARDAALYAAPNENGWDVFSHHYTLVWQLIIWHPSKKKGPLFPPTPFHTGGADYSAPIVATARMLITECLPKKVGYCFTLYTIPHNQVGSLRGKHRKQWVRCFTLYTFPHMQGSLLRVDHRKKCTTLPPVKPIRHGAFHIVIVAAIRDEYPS